MERSESQLDRNHCRPAFTVSANEDVYEKYEQAMSVLADLDMTMLVRQKRQVAENIDESYVGHSSASENGAKEAAYEVATRVCAKQCEKKLADAISSVRHTYGIDTPFSIFHQSFDVGTLEWICR
uniref:Uncharacterized protein n=1 Tax=Plectus sambesii TaxID=2011161 RepID=A0A914V969_9BILA